MENKKDKKNIIGVKQFYTYLINKIDADMTERNLSTYKIRSVKESGYILSSSTYDNIKAVSKGESTDYLNNKKLQRICEHLNIRYNHKFEILK